MGRVLLVDNESQMRKDLASNLREDQHDVWEVASAEEARRSLADNHFDVVIASDRLPDGQGLAVITVGRGTDPSISTIFLTDASIVGLAVENLRQGTIDFITRPFQSGVARATVRRACERTLLLRENLLLRNRVRRLEGVSEIYGEGPAVREVRERIDHVADEPGFQVPTPPATFDLTALLEQHEKELIVRTLSATGGAQAEAARRMGLSRSALAYKLNKYGIRVTA